MGKGGMGCGAGGVPGGGRVGLRGGGIRRRRPDANGGSVRDECAPGAWFAGAAAILAQGAIRR